MLVFSHGRDGDWMRTLGDCVKLGRNFTLYREHWRDEETDAWNFRLPVWAPPGIYAIIGMTKPNKRGMHLFYVWGATHHGWAVGKV